MNIFKQIPILIACLVFPVLASAGVNLPGLIKIDTALKLNNTGNAISGIEQLASAPDTGGTGVVYLLLQTLKFGDKRILRMTIKTTISDVQSIGRGANVFFTLSDGTVITLANLNNELAKSDPGTSTNQITGNYQLADDDELRLCANKTAGLQLQYDGGVFRFMLKEEEAAVLQRQAIAIK
ncbi:hypothetical protein [Mucilaginibacter sp. R-33]|uniref:hypothetical protein n=1 Tax=Mucilaginibacter sp. R-33 TaxID=3416711 RepID=UPI003CE8F38C